MQHDIYGLGACLLEIGLWCTFVAYQDATASKPMPSIVYPRCDDAASKHELNRATVLKSSLVSFAERELTSHIGDKYAKVAVSCLTCLDTSNPDVIDESEFTDDDNVGVGVRYFEKVSRTKHHIKAEKKETNSRCRANVTYRYY